MRTRLGQGIEGSMARLVRSRTALGGGILTVRVEWGSQWVDSSTERYRCRHMTRPSGG